MASWCLLKRGTHVLHPSPWSTCTGSKLWDSNTSSMMAHWLKTVSLGWNVTAISWDQLVAHRRRGRTWEIDLKDISSSYMPSIPRLPIAACNFHLQKCNMFKSTWTHPGFRTVHIWEAMWSVPVNGACLILCGYLLQYKAIHQLTLSWNILHVETNTGGWSARINTTEKEWNTEWTLQPSSIIYNRLTVYHC